MRRSKSRKVHEVVMWGEKKCNEHRSLTQKLEVPIESPKLDIGHDNNPPMSMDSKEDNRLILKSQYY